MALDPSGSVTYLMSVDVEHKEYLGAIRHWNNLKISFEDALIWVKDFTAVQVDSIEVKSIPYKKMYYSSGHQLFLQGSLLPCRNVPTLLWTPIERGLPVRLPAFNHNYFGIQDKINLRLVTWDKESGVTAQIVNLEIMKAYIKTAPAVRLRNLAWALAEGNKAIIFGAPVLPLNGEVFWRSDDFLFPAGYALELHALANTVNKLLNPEGTFWIIWNKNGEYRKLDKHLLKPLSVSSFRISLKQ